MGSLVCYLQLSLNPADQDSTFPASPLSTVLSTVSSPHYEHREKETGETVYNMSLYP